MLLSEIQDACFARIQQASGLIPSIFDRASDGRYHANGKPYASASIVPFEIREPRYCNSVLRSGILLVNVFAPNDYGTVGATLEAEKFAALFPEGLEINELTIPDPANIRGAARSEITGWFYVSTLIYFEAR